MKITKLTTLIFLFVKIPSIYGQTSNNPHHGCECVDVTMLQDKLNAIQSTMADISDHVLTIDDTKCRCEDQFIVLYNKVCKQTDAILAKISNIEQQNMQCNNQIAQETLQEIGSKLDLIFANVIDEGENDCGCLSKSQFEKEIAQYCEHQGRRRGRKGQPFTAATQHLTPGIVMFLNPGDIPIEDSEHLLAHYERCIEDAIRDLDKWFDDDKWDMMPTSVKMVIITLYCKVGLDGLDDQNTKDFMSMKSALEEGDWTDASDKLSQTEWARQYPDAAKEIVQDLKNVKEEITQLK